MAQAGAAPPSLAVTLQSPSAGALVELTVTAPPADTNGGGNVGVAVGACVGARGFCEHACVHVKNGKAGMAGAFTRVRRLCMQWLWSGVSVGLVLAVLLATLAALFFYRRRQSPPPVAHHHSALLSADERSAADDDDQPPHERTRGVVSLHAPEGVHGNDRAYAQLSDRDL